MRGVPAIKHFYLKFLKSIIIAFCVMTAANHAITGVASVALSLSKAA